MQDPRIQKLARQLIRHSTRLKRGEHLLIECFDAPSEIGIALLREARAVGANPTIQEFDTKIRREMYRGATESQFKQIGQQQLALMKKQDAYIAVRGANNITESADVPTKNMAIVQRHMKKVLDWRVSHTKWCVLRWPTPSMAQLAGMSTEAFEDFYFESCLLDYAKRLPAMRALKRLMDITDKVHITGPGTDLRFSIKDMNSIVCGGEYNIPDGEVFTAPIRDSVQGVIQYNTPTVYHGINFENVRLEFKDGKIIHSSGGNDRALKKIFNTDEGARYIGEFAIGFHPNIREAMRDILFDEKIAGSFHFTPGQAYDEADNGNRSKIHWDLVCIQRKEHGGGEIWFDGKLIRKNGIFIPKGLQRLNA